MVDVDSFPVIVVSGLSGAGKSTVLRVFEDLRFFLCRRFACEHASEIG